MVRHVPLVAAGALCALLGACGDEDGGDARSASVSDITAFTMAPTQSATLGCRSRSGRYPWGRADLRTWTPKATAEREYPLETPGTAFGMPFAARLVQAWGDDYGDARRTVVLEMEDGCRRQFRDESFTDADRAMVANGIANHPLKQDTGTYRIAYRENLTSPELVKSGALGLVTTQHFAIWYGSKREGNFYRTIADQGRSMEQVLQETGEWLEKQWLINREVLGAPMPQANSSDRKKLDVFLCGTGRPLPSGDDLGECGATAAEVMNVSAWAVSKGSNTLTHEFGHMIQFYTGGFRDKGDAGMIWETGAEWNAFMVNPAFNASSHDYLNQLENGFLFSPARYGASPIMTFLFEKDSTRDLIFGSWLRNLRNAEGASQEDYLPAFVRLARAAGVYPNGFASFADDAGWYGARLVAMDFQNQRALLDQLRATRTTTWNPHFFTPLAAVATTTDRTSFAPPTQRPLRQWGTHIVPLSSAGQEVKATLTGGTVANEAAWRFTLVAVDAAGRPTYAPMASVVGKASATATMKPPAGTSLYLAVTATPYVYETMGWQENGKPINGTTFPYRVKIEGATPRTGPADACDPTTQPGARTSNYTLSGNSDAGRPCG